MIDPLNIVIAGVGGQGNILASQLLASAMVREGLFVNIGETYGAAQRGGSVTSQVRISAKREFGPLIPANEAHAIIGFEPIETMRVLPALANSETLVIFNDRPMYPAAVLSGRAEYPSTEDIINEMADLITDVRCVSATDLAAQAGNAKALNVVMLGCMAGTGVLPVKDKTFTMVFEELFSGKTLEVNKKAFQLGKAAVEKQDN